VRKFKLFSVIIGMLFCLSAFADGEIATIPNIENPHHISIGYDVFKYDVKTMIKDKVSVDDSLVFAGLTAEYEYVKDNNWYSKLTFSYFLTDSLFKSKSIDNIVVYKYKDYSQLLNLEDSIGYRFNINSYNVTPYGGIGIYSLDSFVNNEGFKETLPYAYVGGMGTYSFTKNFEIGVDLRLFHTFCAEKSIDGFFSYSEDANELGCDVSMLLKWNFGTTTQWSLSFKPFFTKFNFDEKNQMFGGKVYLGHSF
jgi:hypothetical protein